MSYLIDRFSEPTSKAALIAAISVTAAALASSHADFAVLAGVWVMAIVGVFTKEGDKTADLIKALSDGASKVAPIIFATVLCLTSSACAPVTKELDKLTNTSLQDRCQLYFSGALAASELATIFPEVGTGAAVTVDIIRTICSPAPHGS
jgi:hypothetical protein